MKHAAIMAMAFCIASCSSLNLGCIAESSGSQLVSTVIVAQLQCVNAPQVEADVLAQAKKLNLCPASVKQGPIANAICPAVTQLVSSLLANNIVPASWECSSANAQAGLQAALQAACQKLPLAPAKK